MDDAVMDAAQRLLFAAVGKRQQEYPLLVPLREFLSQYLSAKPLLNGHALPSLRDETGLVCAGISDPDTRRRQGIPPFFVHDSYRDAVMRAGGLAYACLDPGVLYSTAPRDWVPIIAALISEGPERASARAQAAIYDFSLELVQANRRRPAGRRAASSVKHVLVEGKGLFRLAHQLRGLPACQQWTYVPDLELPHMPRGGYEVVAPRVEVIRQALHDVTGEIHARLRVEMIEEELAGLDALSDDALLSRGLWRPMRDRLLLVLMVLTGGRRSAIARLRRGDYIADSVGPPPDCRRGALLDLRPQKGKDRDEVRRKPIPRQAALVLESYLVLMDRVLAAKGQPPATASSRLLVGVISHHTRPVKSAWIYRRVAGKIGGEKPLVMRDARQMPAHIPDDYRPYCGYTPHEFRHFANQLAERAGDIFNKRNPATGGEVNPPISYYAAALLDNGGAENDMRALYGDRRGTAMLEVIAGRAAEVGWEILTTGVGLRKRANVDAYEHELICLRRIEDEELRLERAAQKLQAKRARCDRLALPSGDAAQTDRLDVIISRQEDLIASVDELKEMMLESSAITHKLVQLSRQKADTIKKLDKYRFDEATWVPISDLEPPGAERVDWEAIDRGALGKPLMPGEVSTAVRDWLTFREFCQIADLRARSTLTRWVKGEHLPVRRDKRPWEPDDVPVDASLGANYRRIWVPGVHDAFWRTPLMRKALAETLGRWPKEQGWTTKDGEPTWRCSESLSVSPPRLRLAA